MNYLYLYYANGYVPLVSCVLLKLPGDKNDAMQWYQKGIHELESGLAVQSMGASPEDKEKIIRLQAKMQRNLEMAKERLAVLRQCCCLLGLWLCSVFVDLLTTNNLKLVTWFVLDCVFVIFSVCLFVRCACLMNCSEDLILSK